MKAKQKALQEALVCIQIASLGKVPRWLRGATRERGTRPGAMLLADRSEGLRMATRTAAFTGMLFGTLLLTSATHAADVKADMANAVSNYVSNVITGLQAVADQQPTEDTFREKMKGFMDATPGVFGASLIDTNFVIRKVYYRRDFLAVDFDLKKVSELDYFWKRMKEKPAAQLSEPAHGSILQPRLLAMRAPILDKGQFKGIVSVMIHTDTFLKSVGLEDCQAFKITCLGKLAEEKGDLPAEHQEIKLTLPSTEWVIQFQK